MISESWRKATKSKNCANESKRNTVAVQAAVKWAVLCIGRRRRANIQYDTKAVHAAVHLAVQFDDPNGSANGSANQQISKVRDHKLTLRRIKRYEVLPIYLTM